MGIGLSRRDFVALGAALVGVLATDSAIAKPRARHRKIAKIIARVPARPASGDRTISFHNLHTKEGIDAVYWRDGRYVPGVMRQIDHVMRDHLSGDIHPMDPGLIDLLDDLRRTVRSSASFQVISGYRSPRTNAWLRRTRPGVAAHSMHVKGKAADIVLADCSLSTLHNAALALREGGVGFYPYSDFVHVDTGDVRQWSFG